MNVSQEADAQVFWFIFVLFSYCKSWSTFLNGNSRFVEKLFKTTCFWIIVRFVPVVWLSRHSNPVCFKFRMAVVGRHKVVILPEQGVLFIATCSFVPFPCDHLSVFAN